MPYKKQIHPCHIQYPRPSCLVLSQWGQQYPKEWSPFEYVQSQILFYKFQLGCPISLLLLRNSSFEYSNSRSIKLFFYLCSSKATSANKGVTKNPLVAHYSISFILSCVEEILRTVLFFGQHLGSDWDKVMIWPSSLYPRFFDYTINILGCEISILSLQFTRSDQINSLTLYAWQGLS